MGIIVEKNEPNTELDQKIRADLRRKAAENASADNIDLVESSDYSKDLKKTSRFGWVWFVLVVLAAISLLIILLI
jgi:hypothetical protein